jgi:hypothetical protein
MNNTKRSDFLRRLVPFATAAAVIAAMAVAGFDVEWLLGKSPMPTSIVSALETHLAPPAFAVLLAFAAWIGRMDRMP